MGTWKAAMGGKAAGTGGKPAGGEKHRCPPAARSRMKLWMVRATTTVLLWTCVVQLTAVGETWGPRVLKGWPSCLTAPTRPPVGRATPSRRPRHCRPKVSLLSFFSGSLSFQTALCLDAVPGRTLIARQHLGRSFQISNVDFLKKIGCWGMYIYFGHFPLLELVANLHNSVCVIRVSFLWKSCLPCLAWHTFFHV
jgi:hypothetical protein